VPRAYAGQVLLDSEVVATVDGEEVARGEFELAMRRKVALTHVYFKTRCNVDDHDGFWAGNYGGENPLEKLKADALRECVGIKVRQMLARRLGIVHAVDHASFREGLRRENDRRERALRKGSPVYGPRELSEGEYRRYLLGNMALRLGETMARGDGTPTSGASVAGRPAAVSDHAPGNAPEAACRELADGLAAKATVRTNGPVWDSLYIDR
jgi:hypothetical protein